MKQVIVDDLGTDYYITEDGKCYNARTGNWLAGQVNYKNGYFSYNLTIGKNKRKRLYAHRMVAIAYIENPHNYTQVNHIDGNKLNNSVDNLEWCTASQNHKHAIEHELRKNNHVFCFSKDKELVAEYINLAEASKATKVSKGEISKSAHCSLKTLCGGFFWSFEKELGETFEYKKTGKAKKVFQYDLNGKFITSYPSTGIAAKALGVKNGSHIGECCRGKLKTAHGFVWRYVDDIVSPSLKDEENTASIDKKKE